MIIYIDFLVYLYTSFLHFSFLTSTIPLRSIFKCINISKSRQNLNWRKFERSESLTNLWFKWNFHGNWYFSLSDVWGPGKPPAERRDARSCHSFLFFAFSLLVPSVLLPTRYPSLVLVFFFFFFGFPSCARLDSRQLGARHVLYVLEKLEDFRNSWTFRSFHLSLWSGRKRWTSGRLLSSIT